MPEHSTHQGRIDAMVRDVCSRLWARGRLLAHMEAAYTLMSNRERVVQDITNPGPLNIDGKTLTQTELKRVDIKHKVTVDAMVREVCGHLLGKKMSVPSSPEEALVFDIK